MKKHTKSSSSTVGFVYIYIYIYIKQNVYVMQNYKIN